MQKRYYEEVSQLFSAINEMEHHYETADSQQSLIVYKKVKHLLKQFVPSFHTRTESGCVSRCDALYEDYFKTRSLRKVQFEFECKPESAKDRTRLVALCFATTSEGDWHCFTMNPLTKNSIIISFQEEELEKVLDEVLIFQSENFQLSNAHFIPLNESNVLDDYILIYGKYFYLYKSREDGGYKMPKGLGLDHKAFEKYLAKKSKNPQIGAFKELESPVMYLLREYERLGREVDSPGGVEHIKAVENSFNSKYEDYLNVV
ncbi:hypothetical protein [Vibrio sp. THAF190c]|uniref:hypothetical protein n=1 Tax=Vibrio sp. THAF190c TaxID=2587865 RepID=UPI00126962B2|nr:hypothetical protein [Vibrio sp. THAF190c]QFT13388.1 hypothetical protein FIV04_25895 [Vibrio sp. THAF190c]